MSGDVQESLERELAGLTRWEGEDVDAWRMALTPERSAEVRPSRRFASLLRWRTAPWMLTGIAAAIQYFTTAISRAAERGVQALINTMARLILVLIGGAIWIILAVIAAIFVIRRLRAPARTG